MHTVITWLETIPLSNKEVSVYQFAKINYNEKIVQVEREGDWPLHLCTAKDMIPYFYTSSHVSYARYAVFDLCSNFIQHYSKKLMTGKHVMHHQNSLWNANFQISLLRQPTCDMFMDQ